MDLPMSLHFPARNPILWSVRNAIGDTEQQSFSFPRDAEKKGGGDMGSKKVSALPGCAIMFENVRPWLVVRIEWLLLGSSKIGILSFSPPPLHFSYFSPRLFQAAELIVSV